MLKTGTLLQGRFEIMREIGRGGMGAVYEGRDRKFNGSRVAIKQCLLTSEQMRRAFFREASLLAELEHSYLPDVKDHFVEGDGHFLVMKFIEGDNLESILLKRGEPFGVAEVKPWIEQLLDVLAYIHGLKTPVIHRDIKPGNIKLTPTGHIKLLDFGLAKGGNGATSISGYSLNYAAPEQIQETGSDARSDLYSVGATMFRLLSGQHPKSAFERFNALLNDKPDPLVPVNHLNPRVSEEISRVIEHSMALKQKDRIQNATEMKRRLAEAEMVKAKVELEYSPTQFDNPGYYRTEVIEHTSVYRPTTINNKPKPSGLPNTLNNEGEAFGSRVNQEISIKTMSGVIKVPESSLFPALPSVNQESKKRPVRWAVTVAASIVAAVILLVVMRSGITMQTLTQSGSSNLSTSTNQPSAEEEQTSQAKKGENPQRSEEQQQDRQQTAEEIHAEIRRLKEQAAVEKRQIAKLAEEKLRDEQRKKKEEEQEAARKQFEEQQRIAKLAEEKHQADIRRKEAEQLEAARKQLEEQQRLAKLEEERRIEEQRQQEEAKKARQSKALEELKKAERKKRALEAMQKKP